MFDFFSFSYYAYRIIPSISWSPKTNLAGKKGVKKSYERGWRLEKLKVVLWTEENQD